MASKRDSHREAPPSSSGGIEVRASWIEIEIDMPPEGDRPRAPALSLPGIEVQDEWLEPSARDAAPAKAPPKAPPRTAPAARKAVDPFLGMRMPVPPRAPRSAPQEDFDDEAPTVPRRRA